MSFTADSRLTRRSLLKAAGAAGLTLAGLPVTAGRAATSAVRIAVVVDTSGAGGVYGAPVLKGMRLAASEINAKGGIGGQPLVLDVTDGRSDPARVAALVRAATRDAGIVAMAGPTLSSEAVKVDRIAQRAGLPVLAVNNTVPGLTTIGNEVFRIALGDAQIIPAVMRTAERHRHFKSVALLYDRVNAATAGEAEVFRTVAGKMGFRIVAAETFTTGATQFARQLAVIKAARPDAILVAALAQEAVFILKQRPRAGIPAATTIIGANGLNTPAIIKGAGGAAERVIVGTAYDPGGMSARNRHFKAAFSGRYHVVPDVFAAQGYDGIYVLAAALRHAHTASNRKALRAALADLKDVPTVLSASGRFSFTARREPNLTPTVRIVRHGRFVRYG
jgi:branched-chain amino acid transport system substrate-binding protein